MNTFPVSMVLLSVLITVSFVVLILSTWTGLQLGNTLVHPSPFVAFEAVWPGQSIESLAAYARQTPQGHLPCLTGASPHRNYIGLDVRVAPGAYNTLGQAIKCADYPKDGIFRVIGLTIIDDQIQQLEFYSDVLPEDVLLFYWGMPDSIIQSSNPQLMELSWDRRTYSAMMSVVKSNAVVNRVTLTTTD